MRILAVRGQNLASLTGPFDVDFTQPPLDRSGVFAITGPTGSGKSTLLDAICLALFDRIPRLRGKVGGAHVGAEGEPEERRLLSNDVRGILRRGATHGFAEVDFAGRDGCRWRATWAVQRARRKAGERLQAQVMKLHDIDTGVTVGGNKTEVLAAIKAHLGLDFDQFRRSVLLAQGDFAAFLRAGIDERAALLEAMTGTGIYARISELAFARARSAEERLRSLETQRGQATVLDAAARSDLEEQATAASRAVDAAKAAVAGAETVHRWHQDLASARDRERSAEEGATTARARQAGAAGQRAEMERTRLAESLRAVFMAWGSAVAAAQRAQAATGEAAAKVSGSEAAEVAARVALEAAAARHGDAGRARSSAAPDLEAARRLDGLLAARAPLEQASAEAVRKSEKESVAAAGETARLEKDLARAQESADAAMRWLEGHQDLEPLTREWPRWKAELERAGRNASDARRSGTSVKRLEAERESISGQLAALVDECRTLKERLDTAESAWNQARAAAEALPLGAAHETLATLTRRCESLKALAVLHGLILEASKGEARESAIAESKEREAAERDSAAAAATTDKEVASQVLVAADAALARARRVESLTDHRGRLVEGEPCPLCGATEHPYAEAGSPAPDSEVARLAAEMTAARVRDKDAASREAVARSASEALRQEVARARQAAREHRSSGDRRTQEWMKRLPEFPETGLPMDPASPVTAEALAAASQGSESAAGKCQDALRRAQQLSTSVDERSAAREAAMKVHGERQAERRQKDESAGQLAAELVAARKDHEAALKAVAESLRSLQEAFESRAGWEKAWTAAPEAFLEECESTVNGYRDQHVRLSSVRELAESVRTPLTTANEQARLLALHVLALREAHAKTCAELAELRRQRAQVLEGKAVGEEQTRLDADVTRSFEALEKARTRHGEVREALAGARSACDAAKAQEAAAAEEERGSRQSLDEASTAAGIPVEEGRRLLERGRDWIAARESELRQIDEQVTLAEARHRATREAREAHETSAAPVLAAEEAAPRLEAARRDLAVREEERNRLQVDLAQDDRERGRLGDLLRAIEEERRRSEVWVRLSALIGSADGKSFRRFAQSLTLEVLLELANRRLRELKPRYVLARVPDSDLDLQVIDLDMGGEIRSIQLLSGGETFLVSLALALGLSALVGRELRLGSLFIDEGFGTLDADALDQALGVLDALQATGCQVGVISHVSGLAERIGVQIRVEPRGAGRSDLLVETA